jgi:hypothetical protein
VHHEPDEPGSRHFHYGGLTLRVESADPAPLAWLTEFLTPAFDVLPGALPDGTVTLSENTNEYLDLHRRGPDVTRAEIDGFLLDGSTVRLALWASSEDARIVHDPTFDAFYVVSRRGPRIRVVTPIASLSARNALMRVVRELALNHVRRGAALIVHASALVVGTRAALVIGPKGAGKTTLLTHLLRHGSARFLTNDRAVVSPNLAAPIVRGMPTIVKVLRQTMTWFPDLERHFLDSPYHHRSTLAEAIQRGRPGSSVSRHGYWSLSPAQFCDLLGVGAASHADLAALVFPRISSNPGRVTVDRLAATQAAADLQAGLFVRGSSPATLDFTTAEVEAADRPDLDGLCRRLAARIPSFACELGSAAYRDGTAGELLARILPAA